jgi:hypothetical protein
MYHKDLQLLFDTPGEFLTVHNEIISVYMQSDMCCF